MATKNVKFKSSKGDVEFKATAKSKVDRIVDQAEVAQVITKAAVSEADETARAGVLEDNPRQDGVMAEQFPTAALKTPSKDDVRMTTKLTLADEKGVTPFGRLVATDRDFDWLDKKRAAADELALQTWFAENFDNMTPEGKKLAHRLLPSFYKQREQLLDKMIRLQGRIARVKLHGPRSKADLMLLYALESGLIPSDPLENILHPEKATRQQTEAKRKENWQRGLLNPRAHARSGSGQDRETNAKTLLGYDSAPTYNSGETSFFFGRPSQASKSTSWLDKNGIVAQLLEEDTE